MQDGERPAEADEGDAEQRGHHAGAVTILRVTYDVPAGKRPPRIKGAVVDRLIAVPTN